MTVANFLLMPISDFASVMGVWLLGMVIVGGSMLMLAWRDEAQGK